MTIASIFLFTDYYYILWILSLVYKFPNFVASSLVKSFFGIIENLHQALGRHLAEHKKSYAGREQRERKIYLQSQLS